MEKNTEYFENQINGLILIMEQKEDNGRVVFRNYVIEKLNMILQEGIGFYPDIEEKLHIK